MRGLLLGCLLVSLSACATEQPQPNAASSLSSPSRSSPAAVTMHAADGGTLTGHIHGSGSTAVVLSNMGDNNPGPWDEFAPILAARGYTVLTYRYRDPLRTAVADLQAAITYLRSKRSTRLALVGASLGGMTSAKVAGAAGAAAVILIACPLDIDGYDFRVTDQELAALTAPKLVIASQDDNIVPFAKTRAVYDRAPQPKEFASYPSTAHGVKLFDTAHREALQKRLLEFLTANAAP